MLLIFILEVHAGAGGTESQDWAEMLRRMYIKWFDKKNFSYEIISEHKGEEAGIKVIYFKSFRFKFIWINEK